MQPCIYPNIYTYTYHTQTHPLDSEFTHAHVIKLTPKSRRKGKKTNLQKLSTFMTKLCGFRARTFHFSQFSY